MSIHAFLILLLTSNFAHAGDDELARKWQVNQFEPAGKTAALAVPRMLSRMGTRLVKSATWKRAGWTVTGPAHLLSKKKRIQGAFEISNSFLNPVATANALVSDVGGVLKSPYQIRGRTTSRVQFCSINLADVSDSDRPHWYHYIMPAFHVSIVVDGIEEFGDTDMGTMDAIASHGAVSCVPAEIVSGEDESVAIERLYRVSEIYSEKDYIYNFMSFNCGGIAEKVLEAAGFRSPVLPNLGIGADIGIPSKDRRQAKDLFEKSREASQLHLARVSYVFELLKSDDPANRLEVERTLERFKGYNSYVEVSPDLLFDLTAMALKHPRVISDSSQAKISASMIYFYETNKIKEIATQKSSAGLRRTIAKFLDSLSDEELNRLTEWTRSEITNALAYVALNQK